MIYVNTFETEAMYIAAKNSLMRPQLALSEDLMIVHCIPDKPDMIDLGLPSRTLWADRNLGATCGNTPESWYGNYYSWGETEIKSNYTAATYKFGQPPSKYGDDGKTVLEPIDDTATARYYYPYKMPTEQLINELLNDSNTDFEYITNYEGISGLNGGLLTSKHNGNTLFLPRAGYYNGTVIKYDDYSYIWSSCVWSSNVNYAKCMRFKTDKPIKYDGFLRYTGLSVRPVCN